MDRDAGASWRSNPNAWMGLGAGCPSSRACADDAAAVGRELGALAARQHEGIARAQPVGGRRAGAIHLDALLGIVRLRVNGARAFLVRARANTDQKSRNLH